MYDFRATSSKTRTATPTTTSRTYLILLDFLEHPETFVVVLTYLSSVVETGNMYLELVVF
jgi:hypothetical protein